MQNISPSVAPAWDPFWLESIDINSPVVAAAIHDGDRLHTGISNIIRLNKAERLREEDPVTGLLTEICGSRIVGRYSRFETDLNRPPEKAVYRKPEDAWGLRVYDDDTSESVFIESLERYHSFYEGMAVYFDHILQHQPYVVVLDLHTYNHRRMGADGPEADPSLNPQINLGTGTNLNPRFWRSLIDRFISDLSTFSFSGGLLDVRENVKFQGGYFARWLHARYPGSICVLSVEFKKFFMDEWSGMADIIRIHLMREALQSTLQGIMESLWTLTHKPRNEPRST